MKNLNVFDWVALVLVIVGALNWGLVGAFDFNLVEVNLGIDTLATQIVYDLVAASGVYLAVAAGMGLANNDSGKAKGKK
jgi:uncharacterized protein